MLWDLPDALCGSKRSGYFTIDLLMDRTGFSEHPAAQVVNNLAAKFVNWQMGYGREHFFEDLNVRWNGLAPIATGGKNLQRRQNKLFWTHNLQSLLHFT